MAVPPAAPVASSDRRPLALAPSIHLWQSVSSALQTHSLQDILFFTGNTLATLEPLFRQYGSAQAVVEAMTRQTAAGVPPSVQALLDEFKSPEHIRQTLADHKRQIEHFGESLQKALDELAETRAKLVALQSEKQASSDRTIQAEEEVQLLQQRIADLEQSERETIRALRLELADTKRRLQTMVDPSQLAGDLANFFSERLVPEGPGKRGQPTSSATSSVSTPASPDSKRARVEGLSSTEATVRTTPSAVFETGAEAETEADAAAATTTERVPPRLPVETTASVVVSKRATPTRQEQPAAESLPFPLALPPDAVITAERHPVSLEGDFPEFVEPPAGFVYPAFPIPTPLALPGHLPKTSKKAIYVRASWYEEDSFAPLQLYDPNVPDTGYRLPGTDSRNLFHPQAGTLQAALSAAQAPDAALPGSTLFPWDFPRMPKSSSAGSLPFLTPTGYEALESAAPWDAMIARLARVSRTLNFSRLSATTQGLVTELLQLIYDSRRAIWERTHWLPLSAMKASTAAVASQNIGSGAEQTRARAQASFWERVHKSRRARMSAYLNRLRRVSKDLHSVPAAAELPRCFWMDPCFPFFHAEHPIEWHPSSTDLVVELRDLDRCQPVRLHWARYPSLHPFFRHCLARWYPNVSALPWPADIDNLFSSYRPSPVAVMAALPGVITFNQNFVRRMMDAVRGTAENQDISSCPIDVYRLDSPELGAAAASPPASPPRTSQGLFGDSSEEEDSDYQEETAEPSGEEENEDDEEESDEDEESDGEEKEAVSSPGDNDGNSAEGEGD
jgi:hypothetical protein